MSLYMHMQQMNIYINSRIQSHISKTVNNGNNDLDLDIYIYIIMFGFKYLEFSY